MFARRLSLAIGLCLAALAAPAPNGYVDGRVCAGCHSQIAQDYRRTGMGRSFFRPDAANTIEDYKIKNEFYHALSDTRYAMVARDGAYYQRRWQSGVDGKETNVEEAKIDYVLGSGNHSRSYLHRTPRGTLIELPLGWYAEKGGFWEMSPGFDSVNPATRRTVSYECVFCHNAYPRIPTGHDKPGAEPVFAGELPEGIDCQRCHGPGANHVRIAQARGRSRQQIRGSIVNPARMSASLRLDLCMQCHLQPTSSAIPSLIRRFDRGPFSFKPGEPLSSFLLAFDHAPGKQDDKFEIAGSSAYRLRQSRCFLESKGKMTCETCHDPHRTFRGEAATERYAKACGQCHSMAAKSSHPASQDCATCHMPKRRTEDVVHVMMTDHKIQRKPNGAYSGDRSEYRGEVVPYFGSKPADALYEALAQVAMKNNLEAGTAQLEKGLAAAKPKEPEWYLQLGDGWLANGAPQKAVTAYEKAVQLEAGNVRALQSLAKGLRASGENARSSVALRRAIQVEPENAQSWYQAGMLGQSDAIDKLQKAVAIDPNMPGVYTNLGGAFAAAGQADSAQAAYREALRINPYDAAAWDLLGRTLVEKRVFTEAFHCFEKAIRHRPNFAPYLYDYALALSSAGQLDRGQEMAESAVKADPKLAEARVLLGRLFTRTRRLAEAAREYEAALKLRPDLARTRLDLAQVLMTQGDRPGAIHQLKEATKSGDAEAARLANTALQRLGER